MVFLVELCKVHYTVDAEKKVVGVWVEVDFTDFCIVLLAFHVEQVAFYRRGEFCVVGVGHWEVYEFFRNKIQKKSLEC